MRYLYYSIVLIVAASCTELEPELYSDLTTSNAYSTESDIDAALVGVYADLAPFPGDGYMYYNGYFVMITDYAADMGFSTAGGDPTKMGDFTYDDNNRYFKFNWRYMFEVISNANVLISKIEEVDMDETKRKQIIAQALFLRALAYRDATDAWGPVPLLTELVNPIDTYDMALSPVSDVDAVIIEDLKYAIDNLPEEWDIDEGLTRATKGAALTLLGKIYLRAHDYSSAKIYIDQVLQLRDQGVYSMNPDFKDVWSENNKVDQGSIFSILHESSQNGGEITNHFGPTDHREISGRWQYYAVSLDFWRRYHDEDPRKQFFYFDYEGKTPRDGSTTSGFNYVIPEPGQTEPNDPTEKLLKNVATKKYSYEMVSNSYYDGRTISIFRLADVILNKAEIENELSGPGAALVYLNEIRGRAGAPLYGGHPDFPSPMTKEDMAQKILDERGFELVFEYKRRPDLIRFRKYEEMSNNYLISRGLAPIVTSNTTLFPYPLVDALINSEMAAANPSRLP